MRVSQAQFNRTAATVPRAVADRRRHKRFAITLLGRFMRQNKHEYPCKLNDISVGGAAVASPVVVEIGERIVAYFDQLGGIEGTVVRVFDGGFAVQFNATQHKKEKLAAQITWLVNKSEITGLEARRHERVKVNDKFSTLKLAEGIATECRVLDVSLSGAAVETLARPPVGSEVVLGKLRCRVMRHHEKGVGLQFLDIQEPGALRRYFG